MSLLLSLAAAAAAPALPQVDCAALTGTYGTTVVDRAATVEPATAWRPTEPTPYRPLAITVPFCRVEGRIEGNIGFELWLPAQWNGRLLGAGVGGDAGIFNYYDMSARIAQGFATVTTDSGHKASDARWMRNAKARTDYEHRASHMTAGAAKALAARFYARPVDHSYYLGCSGGGRQALKEMQNYPGDYDGVVAGAPGPNMPLQSVRMLWFSLAQQSDPAGALTDADWSLYEARSNAACDALDGVRDGVVENPMQCRFKTATLLCKPGETAECLTPAKRAMLDRIIAPMPDEQGKAMDGGLFPGVRTRPGPPSPLLRAMWADAVYDDANWDAKTFRRSADLAAINRIMPELRTNKTAIAPFIQRGGKAIIYQGWQDPSTNAGPTLDYYAALARANGGYQKLGQSVRLFMVPGMYHCRGGPGADLFGGSGHFPALSDPDKDVLWSLIRWVEAGVAPASVTASRMKDGAEVFTRKLCPFPQAARYKANSDDTKAASFECVSDAGYVASLATKPRN